ncbi:response regulator [Puteibacter caeruleilacunae]|nr:response regulator [Puteibacter caeruleilacunae]
MNVLIKILIIDNEKRLLRELEHLLLSKDYLVLKASNGAEGLQLALMKHPDLILCDTSLEDMDGYQVLKVLRQSKFTWDIPFIFMTSNGTLQNFRMGMELGVDDFLVKPFSHTELINAVKTRIDRKHKLNEAYIGDLKSFAEITPNGICLSMEGKMVYYNTSLQKLLKLDVQDHNRCICEFIEGEESEEVRRLIERVEVGINIEEPFFAVLKNKCGKKIPVHIYATRIHFASYYGCCLLFIKTDCKEAGVLANTKALNTLIKILQEENIAVTPSLREKLVRSLVNKDQSKELIFNYEGSELLSKRELQVLELSCHGYSLKEIARELCISDRTVEKHRANLMSKTNSKSVVDLVIYAFTNNLVDIKMEY